MTALRAAATVRSRLAAARARRARPKGSRARRTGCGCAAAGCGCVTVGCLAPLLALVIAFGAVGVVFGRPGDLAVPPLPPAVRADVSDIPPVYLALYQDAARRFGLDWPVLAAVGKIESNHGAAGCATNRSGARGPMQFLAGTFAHAARLAHIADPDICDPVDAIPAAAAYLRSNGAPDDWEHALYRYNPADWYPPLVLRQAARYGYGARAVWPVTDARISQGFGPTSFTGEPARCWRGRCYAHFHDGLDFAAPVGTPVLAIAAGRVTLAGRVADGAVVVMVDHGGRIESLYGHLEPGLDVRDGDLVAAGTRVGSIGLTGHTTGPHLHLEVLVSGEPVDPLDVLPADGR